jgi:hypothetical protein
MNSNDIIIKIEKQITQNRDKIAEYNRIIIEYSNMDRGQGETNSMIRFEEKVLGLINTNEQLNSITQIVQV